MVDGRTATDLFLLLEIARSGLSSYSDFEIYTCYKFPNIRLQWKSIQRRLGYFVVSLKVITWRCKAFQTEREVSVVFSDMPVPFHDDFTSAWPPRDDRRHLGGLHTPPFQYSKMSTYATGL